MLVATSTEQFTVNDAAEKFKRSAVRIRQICQDNDIGIVYGSRIRILTKGDVQKIGRIISKDRRLKKFRTDA